MQVFKILHLRLTVSGLLSQEAQYDIANCKLHMGLQLTFSMNEKIFTSLCLRNIALALNCCLRSSWLLRRRKLWWLTVWHDSVARVKAPAWKNSPPHLRTHPLSMHKKRPPCIVHHPDNSKPGATMYYTTYTPTLSMHNKMPPCIKGRVLPPSVIMIL